MKKVFSVIAISLLLFGFTSRNLSNGGTPLYATMSGAQEVFPEGGDPDGSGWAVFYLNQGQGTISYEIYVEDIGQTTVTHIHFGKAGSNGGVAVGLMAPMNGMSMGVVEVDPEMIKMIRKDPGSYYLNVHSTAFPRGAIRGQLTK